MIEKLCRKDFYRKNSDLCKENDGDVNNKTPDDDDSDGELNINVDGGNCHGTLNGVPMNCNGHNHWTFKREMLNKQARRTNFNGRSMPKDLIEANV